MMRNPNLEVPATVGWLYIFGGGPAESVCGRGFAEMAPLGRRFFGDGPRPPPRDEDI